MLSPPFCVLTISSQLRFTGARTRVMWKPAGVPGHSRPMHIDALEVRGGYAFLKVSQQYLWLPASADIHCSDQPR